MPTYQYRCTECRHQFDAVQSFSEDSLTTCPQCSGKLRKLFGSVGIVFKGSGFYRNDSRAAASTAESGSGKSGEKSGGEKSGGDSGSGSASGSDSSGSGSSSKSGSGSDSKSNSGDSSSSSSKSTPAKAAS